MRPKNYEYPPNRNLRPVTEYQAARFPGNGTQAAADQVQKNGPVKLMELQQPQQLMSQNGGAPQQLYFEFWPALFPEHKDHAISIYFMW